MDDLGDFAAGLPGIPEVNSGLGDLGGPYERHRNPGRNRWARFPPNRPASATSEIVHSDDPHSISISCGLEAAGFTGTTCPTHGPIEQVGVTARKCAPCTLDANGPGT